MIKARGDLIDQVRLEREASRAAAAARGRVVRRYTLDHYNRLSVGMASTEVFEIMGELGREVSNSGAWTLHEYSNADGSGIVLQYEGSTFLRSKSQMELD